MSRKQSEALRQRWTDPAYRAKQAAANRRANRSDLPDRLLAAIRAAEPEVPSVRELQAACGISSTSVVRYHLIQLERRGLLTLGPRGHSRSYRLTPEGRGAATPDELLLRRCLVFFEAELGATGGALIEDLKARVGN